MKAMEILIKILADGLMVPIVLLAVYALMMKVPHAHRYDIYTRIFMAGISSYLLAKLVGAMWQPETVRPFEKLGIEAGAAFLNNPGFPSDHTLFASFLTLAIWYATKYGRLTIVMVVMTLLVAVGRVLAHVHTPLDVTGGIVFAVIGALWYIGLKKPHLRKHIAKKAKK
jgi:membrane-associated phospholipid phosphatase